MFIHCIPEPHDLAALLIYLGAFKCQVIMTRTVNDPLPPRNPTYLVRSIQCLCGVGRTQNP